MRFKARIYKQSKGSNQPAYIAVPSREVCVKLGIKRDSPIMLRVNGKEFVSVMRKISKYKDSIILGFTVPFRIGQELPCKKDIIFDSIEFNLNRTQDEKPGFVNLQKIIPDKTLRGYPIYIFDSRENNLLFWIYARGNKTYILPKFVPMEKSGYSLLELFGAFLCEGFKSRKDGRHRDRLSFSSIEKDNIEWFLNSLETLLQINKNQWKCQILYPKNDIESVRKIKRHWSDKGIPEDNISIIKNSKMSGHQGVCILNIYNSTLSEIFQFIMDYCKKISLKTKENSINVFRGFSRGDIGISKNSVSFSAADKGDAILFQKICRNIGVKTSKIYNIPGKRGYWLVFITGRDNFERILMNDAITYQERKIKLIKNLLENKKFPVHKYLKSIARGYNTSKSASDFLNLSQISTRAFLSRYEKGGYLKSIINKKSYNQKIYSFTRKGEEKYMFLRNLEKQAGG